MTTPVIPTLMGDINRLSDPIDIMKYILKWYTSVPKNINDTFATDEISFRWDDASSGHNPDQLKSQVSSNLKRTLSKYFPNASSIDVDVTTEQIDDVRYSIIIDMLVVNNGVPYNLTDTYNVDSGGNLIFAYKGE
jgi:hypothetical protein